MGGVSLSRQGACGPATGQVGDAVGAVDTDVADVAAKMNACDPLTPETAGCLDKSSTPAGCPDKSSTPAGGPCLLSGCSSSSSFVDTTSSRSDGDDAD
eukprot:CAMPEP_0182610092 /NCGR_PEP_ID=MMETSP1330-20130603/5842_1 /TAXON_ID=464278 /ORGANISM="Picochlorum sp., Strain RCC944" /LENGTH=97 /DNA_ID=CAMNT_0024829197 /DNA_START=225 /DNA_END=515 /DNA_ORIENTATION=+